MTTNLTPVEKKIKAILDSNVEGLSEYEIFKKLEHEGISDEEFAKAIQGLHSKNVIEFEGFVIKVRQSG